MKYLTDEIKALRILNRAVLNHARELKKKKHWSDEKVVYDPREARRTERLEAIIHYLYSANALFENAYFSASRELLDEMKEDDGVGES